MCGMEGPLYLWRDEVARKPAGGPEGSSSRTPACGAGGTCSTTRSWSQPRFPQKAVSFKTSHAEVQETQTVASLGNWIIWI